MVFSNSQPQPQPNSAPNGYVSENFQQGAAPVNQPPVVTSQPAPIVPDPAFEQFNQQFKQYAGYDFKEATTAINELRTWKQTQAIREQEQKLQQVWEVPDNEFQYRLNTVRDEWNRLPEQERQAILYRTGYDEMGAASILWKQIESREPAQPEYQVQQPETPQLDKSTVAPNGRPANTRFKFSQQQINSMSNDEYNQYADAIAQAYANGQVLRDIY